MAQETEKGSEKAKKEASGPTQNERKAKSKLDLLLNYESVKTFYKSFFYISRSNYTKQLYLKVIFQFCKFLKKNPDVIVKEMKEKGKEHVNSVVRDFLMYLSDKGTSPKTQNTYLSTIKTFLKTNGIELGEEIKRPRSYTRSIDRAPTKEEVKFAIASSDLETRALIAFLVSTGARLGEAIAIQKSDLDLEGMKVRIRPEIAKDRVGRVVFLTPTTAQYLKQYLNSRKDNDNRVFPLNYFSARRKILRAFLKTTDVKKSYGRYEIHPHSLRKFFFTVSLKVLGRELAEALMGHKRYLDSAYLRLTEEDMKKEFQKVVDELEEALNISFTKKPKQIIVPVEEVEKYVAEGYEFKALLPNNKAILSL